MWRDILRELYEHHRYKTLGALTGFLFAVLVIWLGFWWALFLFFCTGFGFWLGKQLDDSPDDPFEVLGRFLPPTRDRF